MSDDRTGKPEWPQDESMETVSSTEGAGQEGPCANPAQAGIQASTSVENLRRRQYAYVQARLSAIEERMGINISTGAQTWGEAMEMIGVTTSPPSSSQSSSQAAVVGTLASGGTDLQRTGKEDEPAPLSSSEDNAVTGVTPIARQTSDRSMWRSRNGNSMLAGRAPRVEGPVPGRPEAPFSQGAQPETMESLRAERDQLALRLADLIAVLPAAIAVRVKHIQQLEECAAQLQRNYDHLAKEGEELHKGGGKLEAALLFCVRC